MINLFMWKQLCFDSAERISVRSGWLMFFCLFNGAETDLFQWIFLSVQRCEAIAFRLSVNTVAARLKVYTPVNDLDLHIKS